MSMYYAVHRCWLVCRRRGRLHALCSWGLNPKRIRLAVAGMARRQQHPSWAEFNSRRRVWNGDLSMRTTVCIDFVVAQTRKR